VSPPRHTIAELFTLARALGIPARAVSAYALERQTIELSKAS
jgi:hypothetical protein